MSKSYNRRKSFIAVVTVLPDLTDTELGEMVYLTSDDKIYVRRQAGWVKTAALS